MANEEIKKEEKKLSKRDFILVIFVILFLSGAIYWNFKTWRKSLGQVELPKFEMSKFEPFPKKEGYKEWVFPDGKLKMKYSADWIETDIETFKSYVQREIEGKPLFLAQKLSFEKGTPYFLIVQELDIKERGTEEIFKKMKEDVKKSEGEMEILKSEEKDKEIMFEAKYTKEGKPTLHSKEKIILNEEKGYLIACLAFEQNWPEFQKEAEEILNSITVLE